MLVLKKASEDGVCFCTCKEGLVGVPNQLDCPWCGCGWLFCCVTCGKAFTFATPVEVDADLTELVRQDYLRRGYEEDELAELVEPGVEYLTDMYEDLEPGHEYVYLDGAIIDTATEPPIQFEGFAAAHDLAAIPHLAARQDPSQFDATVGDPEYWESRALPEEDESEEDDQ